MLCKRCMTVMGTGTTYEHRKDGRLSARRFHECQKCHDKIYTKEPSFQECISKASEKCKNK